MGLTIHSETRITVDRQRRAPIAFTFIHGSDLVSLTITDRVSGETAVTDLDIDDVIALRQAIDQAFEVVSRGE